MRFHDHPLNQSTDLLIRCVCQAYKATLITLSALPLWAQYDVPTLKNLAFDHIRNELKKCDIVEETFSEFTPRCAQESCTATEVDCGL